jgi:hypothetical protein
MAPGVGGLRDLCGAVLLSIGRADHLDGRRNPHQLSHEGPVHPRRLFRAIMLSPSRDHGTGTLDVGAWPVRAAYAAAPSLPPAFQPSQQKRGGHRGGVRRSPDARQCRADQVAAAIPEPAHIDAGSPPVTSSWRRTLGALRRDGSARPPPHGAGSGSTVRKSARSTGTTTLAYSNGTAEGTASSTVESSGSTSARPLTLSRLRIRTRTGAGAASAISTVTARPALLRRSSTTARRDAYEARSGSASASSHTT